MGGRRYGPGHSHHSPDHHRHPPRRLVRLTSLAADGRLRRLLPEDDSRPPGFVLREVAQRDTGRQPWAAVKRALLRHREECCPLSCPCPLPGRCAWSAWTWRPTEGSRRRSASWSRPLPRTPGRSAPTRCWCSWARLFSCYQGLCAFPVLRLREADRDRGADRVRRLARRHPDQLVLFVMHLAIAVVTYNCLVRIARTGQAR